MRSETAATLMTELTAERDDRQSRLDDFDRQIDKLNEKRAALKSDLIETTNLIRALERHEEQENAKSNRKDDQ